jgi:GntR family transcriptional regulator
MFDRIDPRSPTPLYAQIAARIRGAVAAGELAPGQPLPSVRQLSANLRVNPATIVQAYRALEAEGFVDTRHGSGTFVRGLPEDLKRSERRRQARTLVRQMIAQAAQLGINTTELRAAIQDEMGAIRNDGRSETREPRVRPMTKAKARRR